MEKYSLIILDRNFSEDLCQVRIRNVSFCSSFKDYILWGSLHNLNDFYVMLIDGVYEW